MKFSNSQKRTASLSLAFIGMLVLFAGIVGAANPYLPITIHNGQSTNAPAGFQQMITFNAMNAILTPYEANDLGNIRFSVGAMTANSWCETGCNTSTSNSVFWVRMANVIGGASNSIINMTFLPKATEYDGIYAGEAPQWTVTGYNTILTPPTVYQNDQNAFTSSIGNGEADVSALDSSGQAPIYLCAGAIDSEGGGSYFQSTSWSPTQGTGYVSTGYQTGNNNCQMYYDDYGGNEGTVGVVGVTQGSYFNEVGNSGYSGSPASVSWTPNTANELDIVLMACGDGDCALTTVPNGCTSLIAQQGTEGDEVDIYSCVNLAVSSQNADVQGSDEAVVDVYQFAPIIQSTPINYGKYDNGPSVFNYYVNFTGPYLPSNWTTYGAPSYSVGGGLTETSVDNNNFVGSALGFNAIAFISEIYGYDSGTTNNNRYFTLSVGAFTVGNGQYFEGENPTYKNFLNLGPETSRTFPPTLLGGTANAVYSLWQTATLAYGAFNYRQNSSASPPSLNPGYYNLGGQGVQTGFYQWLRRRIVPPNSIMPSIVAGAFIPGYTAPTVSISAPSNAVIDVGQYETFNGVITGGTSTYNVNAIVSNVVTSSKIVASSNDIQSSTSWSFTFQSTSAWNTNSPVRGNVVVTDSNPTTVNSVYTSNIIVNPVLVAGAITPASPVLDLGQSVTLTSHASGGTTAYSYQWYSNSIGNPSCTTQNSISGATSSTYLVSPITSNSYTYKVTDSASTPVSVCSSSDSVTVQPALGSVSITPATPLIVDAGQTIPITATISSQQTAYVYNFIITNSHGGVVLNNLFSSSTSNVLTWNLGSAPYSGQILYANVLVYDSATTNEVANSIYSAQITVNPSLNANAVGSTILNLTPEDPNIDKGQSVTLSANVMGGTPPYTINWFSQGSCLGSSVATGTGYTITPLSTTTYSYNVVDSASTPLTACSANDIATVFTYPNAQITASYSPTVIINQNEVFTANDFGGAPPYSYNYTVTNSVTGALITSKTYTVLTSTANTFTWTVPNSILGQTIMANIVISDSAYQQVTSKNALSSAVNVITALIANPITPVNSIVVLGSSANLTSHPANGQLPYTYAWYANSIASPSCITANVISGVTTSNYLVAPTSNTFYTYKVTDAESPTNSVCSNADYITVTPVALPYILPPLLPSQTFANNETTLSVFVQNGSYTLNSITWAINGNYLTDTAFNGLNYQSYDFLFPGTYSIQIQICDSHTFCTMATYPITVLSVIPASYWHIQSANIQNITYNASENMRLYFQPYNDTNRIANVTVNWGDGSPLYRVTYAKSITGDLYIHPYANPGYYNISAMVCDAVDNCFTQSIGKISDLTPSQKGPLSVLTAFFFGGAIPSGSGSLSSLLTTPPAGLNHLIPGNWQALVEYWGVIIIITLLLLWIGYQVFIAKFHKHASNWAPFGKLW